MINASFNKANTAAQIGDEPDVPTSPCVLPFQIVGNTWPIQERSGYARPKHEETLLLVFHTCFTLCPLRGIFLTSFVVEPVIQSVQASDISINSLGLVFWLRKIVAEAGTAGEVSP